MRKKRFFQKLYKLDETSSAYMIEVSLDTYDEIYDDWDPSPFKKRDIEDEFNDFVINASQDIPLNFEIIIVLYLPLPRKDSQKETTLISAYKNYYAYALERLNKTKSNLYKKIIYYLLFSVFLLSIGTFFFREDQNLFISVLHEGVFIGGWVFLWEFFTNIFITRRELQEEYRLYKRLYQSDIKFIYLDL
jgi:hypothetical protein